jgi:undecaprenyl-diphosphatase
MHLWQSLFLGVVQGLTEFLPISSSGHLVIIPWLFKFPDPGLNFDVAMHLGTLLAVVSFFWKDIVILLKAFFKSIEERKIEKDKDRLLAWYLIIGCIPGGLAGFLFEKKIEAKLHIPVYVAVFMILLGIILWFADRYSRKDRKLDTLNLLDVIVIGLSQMLALAPGVSRSGITISIGLARGLTREDAARFSFLLSIPIIFGASALKIKYFVHSVLFDPGRIVFLSGFLGSAIAGFLAIKYLLKFVQKNSYSVFVYYRILFGCLIFYLLFFIGR